MTAGSIPLGMEDQGYLLPIIRLRNRFHGFLGMNWTTFLDSLSYKKSSKYRLCIFGIVRNPQFLTGTN